MRGLTRWSNTIVMVACLVSAAGGHTLAQTSTGVAPGYDATKGESLYAVNCATCHQTDGRGQPGAFPPLKGSSVVNKADATKHIRVVLDGLQGGRASGVVYTTVMPPFGPRLSDAEIADIIDYERGSWGNHGKPITAAEVAAERARSQ